MANLVRSVAAPAPRKRARDQAAARYLFLVPYLIVFLLFRFGPIAGGWLISLTRWNLIGSPRWIGVANYRALWHDSLFWVSVKNTLAFTAMAGPMLVLGGLALALLVDQPLRGRYLARVLIFAPYAVMSAVVGVLWNWLYDTNFGIINYYLSLLGLPSVPWLINEHVALVAIVLTTVWWTVGYNMVIFLAGLQEIPTELHEAAIVDGATFWQRFRSITLPLLTPTTYAVVILTLINTGQVFDQIYVMTAGGPGTATLTLVQYMYYQAFQTYNLGYGAAVAYATFAVLLAVTLVVHRLFRREAAA